MQELARPAVVQIERASNLTDAVFDNARTYGDDVCFSRKLDGQWTPITCREFADDVLGAAAGLVSCGVAPGDRVALLSKTRYEWTACDYAIWTAGAVTVPIYETSSDEQIAWILGDSGAVAAIVETGSHAAALERVRPDRPDLAAVFTIEAGGLEAMRAAGSDIGRGELEDRRRSLSTESLATIIYTSGTTGRPKGCELTHGNLLFGVRTTTVDLDDLFNTAGATLLFLPLAHVFARVIQCGCVLNRVRMGFTSDIKNLLADFAAFQPTFILSVPRVFEKVYNTAKQGAHASGKGRVFDRADKVAVAYSEGLDGGGVGPLVSLQHKVFDLLVYSRLRGAIGGKVQYAVSGSAPLGSRLGHFFRGAGINVLEGYGLTETTAGATINRPGGQKVGTVGRPLPGVSVRIADDGEILLKGDNIFRAYWHNQVATKEALEDDGFFHTGDIGTIDDDGFVAITGRKKELIVTAAGKNVAPAVLEDRLRAHPLMSQCIVVGDNQPFIGCLVTIDVEAFGPWKAAHGKPAEVTVADLYDDPDLRADIQTAVDEANKAVSTAEAIKAFRILRVDFTEEGGQLTPTLKLKRKVVLTEFAAEVSALYAGSASRG